MSLFSGRRFTALFRAVLLGVAGLALCANSFGAGHKVVLGQLGQTIRGVGIHSRMTTGSHVYYHSPQYEYLVIRGTRSKKWVAVVLANGSRGYVPRDTVAVLPFIVTGTVGASPSRSAYASRGTQVAIEPSSTDAKAAQLAETYSGEGIPYKWGGTDLQSGIDCSAFVKKMFGAIGVALPRTAAEQALVGQPIYRLENLQAGDRLYFWSSTRGKIGHTGIYLGNGYFVHSSSGKGGVATTYLSPGWLKILCAARR